MMSYTTFNELLKDLSSDSPAPGGGSVAALSGCLGAALVSMVCNLSIGKKEYKQVEKELKDVLKESNTIKKELFNLSKKDAEAYNGVIAAYKILDKEKKKENLQIAYKKAAEVPYEVAKKCIKVMEMAERTSLIGNENAITDSGVGALMAYSGLRGALLNVKVNLKYIKDRNYVAEKEIEIKNLEIKADEVIGEIIGRVERSVRSA